MLSSNISPSALHVEAILGRGACSIVKRARHVVTGEPYALKIFQIRGDVLRKAMLEKELRALCCLDCDSLVGLVGSFYDRQAGEVAMVLEYMDRGSLVDVMNHHHRQHFQSLALPESAVASIAFQMLWGIAYLHYENVIHRDIKPANVLVNSEGEVKLSDFGIISTKGKQEEEVGGEMNCTVVGTTRYMSPERLRARPYSTSSDIWSFGLVVLECATGSSPFESVSSMVELLLTLEETPVEQLVPRSLSEGLQELLCGCLQREPERRIPADILIASPWFESFGIVDLESAVQVMFDYVDASYEPQQPEQLSSSAWQARFKQQLMTSVATPTKAAALRPN